MNIVGFITEYNPFHLGHKFHLEKSKLLSSSTHSIAVMSSSFVQRGEPSFMDKWTRAKMAVENGVDLVVELPFVFSCQSAELFAQGGVSLLHSLNCVDYISFGSEFGEIEILQQISNILIEEAPLYKKLLKENLDSGLSFPKARNNALKDSSPPDIKDYVDDILNKSNNILAIEYLKALNRLGSNIKPLTIKRIGGHYKDTSTSEIYSSATAIRQKILMEGIPSVKYLLPKPSYDLIEKYIYNFNDLNNYTDTLRYLVLTSDKEYLKSIFDMETGLENRMIEKFKENMNLNNTIQEISSKRHTKTRINRILIHLLNRLTNECVEESYSKAPPYIRILASNEKGLEIINEIKGCSDVPIINKFIDYRKHNSQRINKFIEFEERATDIFFLGLNNDNALMKMDYYTSPYIKK